MTGALVVVGTPIGNLGDLSPRAHAALAEADVVLCEDTRRTRALLTAAGIPAGSRLVAVHAHTEARSTSAVVDRVARGERVALVSDAGMPGVSDPGQRLVAACAAAGLAVEVVPGPSAVLAALVLSGLPTERFAFEGFLARKGPERAAVLATLAREARTTVVFESPQRVAATLAELAQVLGPDRPVAVAREITKAFEEVFRGTAAAAAAWAVAHPPRGEIVVVVGPAAVVEVDDASVRAAVLDALADGCTTREATERVVADLGVSRRRAYALALALRDVPG
jgi:16S rRNA (cytidine1402-2'-O)-methyltransferase